jgi:hypothetical protein
MIFRFIGAGLCMLVGIVALVIVLVMPSPMVLADPMARLVYIAFNGFLILIGGGAFAVMLTILRK